MVYAALFLVELVLLVYCAIDIITTPDDRVRNLPKLVWLLLVVVLPLAGGIAWLVAGRPQQVAGAGRTPAGGGTTAWSPRPARPAALSPDDDEAFLRSLRERAEAQRREAERARREGEARRPGEGRPEGDTAG